jgi:hypothetical protein
MKWGEYEEFILPDIFEVVMIDLFVGSDTRIMAGGIKRYLENPSN